MLTKGLRNEQQEKLNQILHIGLQLSFVPETWNLEAKKQLDQILRQTTEWSLPDIANGNIEDWIQKLNELNFSFSNMEQLADLLRESAKVEAEHRQNLKEKALALYRYVQKESSTFSLEIAQKIEALEKEIG